MFCKTFIFILLGILSPKCDAQVYSKEADCEICSCDVVKVKFSFEFQVVCEGSNETTKLVLSERIFQREPKPNLTRKVFVKIANFSEARIEPRFLSKWTSYASCLMNIKDVKTATFPEQAPERAQSGAVTFIFGGIEITNSAINRIPKDLFKKKKTVGLKIKSSQIGSLNLFEISTENLNFVDVENSIIDSIKGIPGMSLKFTNFSLRNKYQSFIKIKDSKIGYIGENSFNFTQIEKQTPAIFLIWKTSIGLMDNSAVTLGKGMIFDLRDSSIGNVLSDGIKITNDDRKDHISIINNFMIINEAVLKGITCDSVTEVRDNIFYINNISNAYSLKDIYQELSCKDNNIINKQIILKTLESIDTTYTPSTSTMNVLLSENITSPTATELTEEITIMRTSETPTTNTSAMTVTMTNTPTTSSETTTSLSFKTPTMEASSLESHLPFSETATDKALIQESFDARALNPQVSTTLFLVVVCLCFFLVLVVLSLSTYVIWNKSRKGKKSNHPEDPRTSCLYEEPSAYFAPNLPKPLKLENFETLDNDTKDDRYQVNFGIGNKKDIICKEESTYMNMN